MKIKVYPDTSVSGSIAYVVADQKQLLSQHTFVEDESSADLIITHASSQSKLSPDITYTHGLYPTQDTRWSKTYSLINQRIFDNIANSLQAVAVSRWGGYLIKRYTGVQPHIIHNGIFYNDYLRKGNPKGPALWGKTVINPVCDPAGFISLAQNNKDTFVSFLDLPNCQKIKPLNRLDLRKYLQGCSVLVATTKENDSLLIMEAMASGVPVLAYDWGMAHERLTHQQGCYLVAPNDTAGLMEGYLYLKKNWHFQSEVAHTVAGFFDWERQKPKLEALFTQTLQEKQAPTRVSIVIPCHNYAPYVKQAIESAQQQTYPCEVIVVDDGSTDDSISAIREANPSKIIHNVSTQGVSQARNAGIDSANGNFIVCLDADDVLLPTFVETLLKGFTKRNISITYAPITLMDKDGFDLRQIMFSKPVDVTQHKQGLNQVPSCCMFRKTWWERCDGYDSYLSFTEDANLWLKMFLLGGKAVQVTQKPLMKYRRHGDNNSLKPTAPWTIFHEQPVLSNELLTLILVGEGMALYHAYWRLKELPYPINFHSDTINPKNYLVLSPNENIQEQAKEKIAQWTQLFSYPPA
jgi:glycosyltransferase involved in cell wall biosynthesis